MNSKPILGAVLLPFLLLGCTPSSTTRQAPGNAQEVVRSQTRSSHPVSTPSFAFYLLNLSWSPEFCLTHSTAAECPQHRAFTLHGLWPESPTGTSNPENCSTAPGPANPAAYSDIYPDAGLLQHEWQTHGTCSGLAPDAFFTLARAAEQSVAIPATLSQLKQQTSLPPALLASQFQTSNPTFPAGSILISCGNNRLTAVEVCMNKSAQPIACPAIHSCRANTVKITPP